MRPELPCDSNTTRRTWVRVTHDWRSMSSSLRVRTRLRPRRCPRTGGARTGLWSMALASRSWRNSTEVYWADSRGRRNAAKTGGDSDDQQAAAQLAGRATRGHIWSPGRPSTARRERERSELPSAALSPEPLGCATACGTTSARATKNEGFTASLPGGPAAPGLRPFRFRSTSVLL
jgi:hypothetical protein